MKYGTVLYRKGADMLTMLSWALSTSHLADQWSWFEPEKQRNHEKHLNSEKTLEEASIIMNNLIHEEIKKISQIRPTIDCILLKINEYLTNVDPLSLNFLTSITNTIPERDISSTTESIKKTRLYFILCQLMFCTNPKSPTLIHDVIADIIEVCGGSRQLIRILNRLGCCSSADTHDRFVTQHAMAQRQMSIWDNISANTFTVTSIDNFDMLQSYSAVYCGDQQRSYHGTTLQLVQPNPVNLVLPFSTVDFRVHPLASAKSQNLRQRQRQISPDSSPHELGKNGPKRQRTVAVQNLPATKHNISNANNNDIVLTLALDNFIENNNQIKEQATMHDKLFSYIFLKHVLHHHTQSDVVPVNATLSEIRTFLNEQNDSSLQHPSTVHYMELVNENPDSTETMSLVAEDLLAKFDEVQDGWVVLVGDGISYKHLMDIKRQYSKALRKLLIFPGDRHILKNYLPILMKIYFCAGLREMAKNSGYHGATLKSVEQCSNFKRSHHFLLQPWEALYREMLHAYIVYNNTTITTDANCILLTSIQMKNSPSNLLQRISELVEDSQTQEKFKKFVEQMSDNDKTWRFWAQFVFTDCFCYLSLYLAIRSSN